MTVRQWQSAEWLLQYPEGNDKAKGIFVFAEDYAEALAAKDAEIERLNQAIRLQGSAAISGMDAAKRVSSAQLEQAARLHAESNPGALNSERAMNAQLTEENERLEAEIAALRALLDSYNLGGWTDAEQLLKERNALQAECERLRKVLSDIAGLDCKVTTAASPIAAANHALQLEAAIAAGRE